MSTRILFEKHYRIHEVAEILGLSFPTIRQIIDKEELSAIKTPDGHRRVPESELE